VRGGKSRAVASTGPASRPRVDKPPVGPQWIHEIKHDGCRLIVRKQGDLLKIKNPTASGALRFQGEI
jgi:ATP-dependent DNA ligase